MTRWTLPPTRSPTAWFNVAPHLTSPPQPPLHPGTREPIGPDDLAPLFPMALIGQEVAPTRGSTSPARCSTSCGCGGRRRWCGPCGSSGRWARRRGSTSRTSPCRPRAATSRTPPCPQAFYNAREGITRLSTETGAGQWGTALAFACAQYDLELQGVHGARVLRAEALPQDPMETVGRRASSRRRSTSPSTPARSAPRSPTLCATASGAPTPTTRSGSVLNHVLLHQTMIGLEAKEQLALAGERLPDVVIAPCGGGSNLGGHRVPVRARRRRAAAWPSSRCRARR